MNNEFTNDQLIKVEALRAAVNMFEAKQSIDVVDQARKNYAFLNEKDSK